MKAICDQCGHDWDVPYAETHFHPPVGAERMMVIGCDRCCAEDEPPTGHFYWRLAGGVTKPATAGLRELEACGVTVLR